MSKKIDKLKNSLNLDSFGQKNEEILRDRKGCLTPEELLYSFSPEAPLELKKKIIDHITECPACRSEFELIQGSQELAAQAERLVSRKYFYLPKTRTLSLFLGHYWKLAVALTILVAIITILFFQTAPWTFLRFERGASRSEMFKMKENISTNPLKISLNWEAIPGVLFYRVELFDENMGLVWKSPPLNQAGVEIPPYVVKQVQTSSFLYWHFLAFRSGKAPVESPVRKIHLSPQ